jgi:hypothetical protein
MSDFRFRRLERYRTGGTADKMELSIPLPKTSTGKVLRRCPNERCIPRLFLLGEKGEVMVPKAIDGISVRREANTPGTTCPYCGIDAPDEEFTHPDDLEAAMEHMKWAAMEDINDMMNNMARGFNQRVGSSRKNFISLKMEYKGKHHPQPYHKREDLIRNLACDICGREYGVYAIALFCPDCGAKNLHVHFDREVELTLQQIDLAESVFAQGNPELSYRILGNAHEDVLTAYETYIKTIYKYLVHKKYSLDEAEKMVTKQVIGNRFQNIQRGQELFRKIGLELYGSLSPEDLEFLEININTRHVIGHNLSLVDEA